MSAHFSYEAYTKDGKIEKGAVEASSLEAALQDLTARGLSVFDIKPGSAAGEGFFDRELFSKSKLSDAQKEQLLRLLAALVRARLPVDQALESIASKTDQSALAKMSRRLHDRIISGASLSQALADEGDDLPPSWTSLVKAGESSGKLDQVLIELSAAQARQNKITAEVRSALIYPMLLGGLAIVTTGFIVTVLLPALLPLIQETGGSLPGPISFLMDMSLSIRTHPLIWLLGVLLFIAVSYRALAKPGTKQAWDQLSLRLPVFGTLIREINTARICSTFGLLLDNRVEQLRAVQIVMTTVSHKAYTDLLQELYECLQDGGTVKAGLDRNELIPDQIISLIGAGERSGRIAEMLIQGGLIMEVNSKRSLDRLVGLLTPALTLLMGLVIGGIVLSVMTTLMSVNNAAF